MTKRAITEMGTAELYARIVSRVLIVAGLISGAAILSVDAYPWLRSGQWQAMSALGALQWLGMVDAAWALSPQDWIGLHWLLSVLPLWLVIPLLSLLVAGVIYSIGRMRGDEQLAKRAATDKAWAERRETNQRDENKTQRAAG